jgi:hypothetical protein
MTDLAMSSISPAFVPLQRRGDVIRLQPGDDAAGYASDVFQDRKSSRDPRDVPNMERHVRPIRQDQRRNHQTLIQKARDIVDDARACIGLLGGDRDWNDSRKTWLDRAARASGVDYSRVYAIWYGRTSRLWADEYSAIRTAADARLLELQNIEAQRAQIRLAIAGGDHLRADRGMARATGRGVDVAGRPTDGHLEGPASVACSAALAGDGGAP